MALKIRLARGGAKKRPFYRIVVAEATAPRDGRFVERVGSYNPILPSGHAERLVLNAERLQYWMSVGAQPTERVARFMGTAGIIAMPAQANRPDKSQPKQKAQERMKAEAEAKKAAAEPQASEMAAAAVASTSASAEEAAPAEAEAAPAAE